MAEKIEFIPANELPVAEGDEVNVLCLENGELKQKAGASLGGSGVDAVIEISQTGASFTFISGTYEAIKEKLLNKERPVINIVGARTNNNKVYYVGTQVFEAYYNSATEEIEMGFNLFWSLWYVNISADGSIYDAG